MTSAPAAVLDGAEARLFRRAALTAPTAALLVLVAVVHSVGLTGWPPFLNEDEGTYMARAWAVQTGLGAQQGLAPYTYWYDHPPFGWMQLAVWTWLTDTFRAGTEVVVSGRIAMVVVVVATTALVYLVARRLGGSRPAGWTAMALFGLSPLAVYYTRLVMLDTIGLPWILGAFALVLSPGRRLLAYAGAGALFAGAVLTKETYLLLLPALVVTLWLHVPRPARRMSLTAFGATFALFGAFYLLFAVLKGELLPGSGHVSLIGAIEWQIAGRPGSGSVLRAGTDSYNKVASWLALDPWLLGAGLAVVPIGLAVRRLRGVTLAFLTFAVMPLRPGYLPDALVTGALPWAALVTGCGVDAAWRQGPQALSRRCRGIGALLARLRRPHGGAESRGDAQPTRHGLSPGSLVAPAAASVTCRLALVALAVAAGAAMLPRWWSGDRHAMTTHANTEFSQAEAWMETHVSRRAVVLTDDDGWTDLVDAGFATNQVIWFWELDKDPAVRSRYPGGWRQVGWVVCTPALRIGVITEPRALPTVVAALAHSRPVARFGSDANWVEIRQVVPAGPAQPPWWLPGYGSLKPPTSGPQKGERL